jgi:hypothetical protein
MAMSVWSHGVGDQHAEAQPRGRPHGGAEGAGGGIRVHRQEQYGALGDVAGVHSGGGHHQALPVLHDAGDPARVRAGRHHAHGLVGDRLLPVGRGDLAALGLGDDLAGHGQDVAVSQQRGIGPGGGEHHRGQVIPCPDLADTGQHEHLEPEAGSRPIRLETGHRYRTSFGSTSRPNTSIHWRWLRPTLCR